MGSRLKRLKTKTSPLPQTSPLTTVPTTATTSLPRMPHRQKTLNILQKELAILRPKGLMRGDIRSTGIDLRPSRQLPGLIPEGADPSGIDDRPPVLSGSERDIPRHMVEKLREFNASPTDPHTPPIQHQIKSYNTAYPLGSSHSLNGQYDARIQDANYHYLHQTQQQPQHHQEEERQPPKVTPSMSREHQTSSKTPNPLFSRTFYRFRTPRPSGRANPAGKSEHPSLNEPQNRTPISGSDHDIKRPVFGSHPHFVPNPNDRNLSGPRIPSEMDPHISSELDSHPPSVLDSHLLEFDSHPPSVVDSHSPIFINSHLPSVLGTHYSSARNPHTPSVIEPHTPSVFYPHPINPHTLSVLDQNPNMEWDSNSSVKLDPHLPSVLDPLDSSGLDPHPPATLVADPSSVSSIDPPSAKSLKRPMSLLERFPFRRPKKRPYVTSQYMATTDEDSPERIEDLSYLELQSLVDAGFGNKISVPAR